MNGMANIERDESVCPTCGQHHLAESDVEELHDLLSQSDKLLAEADKELGRRDEQLRGAVAVDDAAVERAARVLFADYTAQYETTWERDGEAFMDQARRVLDAIRGR